MNDHEPAQPRGGGAAAGLVVHVHGGRLLLDRLAAAGLSGRFVEWSDVLCDGPTPAGLDAEAWLDVRADHLARRAASEGAPPRERLAAQDVELARAVAKADEVVLWFGPELFCQAILLRLVAWWGERGAAGAWWVVTPGDRAGQPGCSVSFLAESELGPAFDARVPLDGAAAATARRLWAAWTAPEPDELAARRHEAPPALPWLADAIVRHLEELPDITTGLARSERQALEAVRAGATTWHDAFRRAARAEARPWQSDLLFLDVLRRLTTGPAPLLAPGPALALTERGEAVLKGRARWRAGRWWGGVRLVGDDSDPAWDPTRREIVRRS